MSIDVKLSQEFEALHERLKAFRSHNLYEALGVPRNATEGEIKAQYWKKAREYHPDSQNPEKPKDAPERMTAINLIYEILSEPVKRASYDEWLGLAGSQQARQPPAGNQGYGAKAPPGSRENPQAAAQNFEAGKAEWLRTIRQTFGNDPNLDRILDAFERKITEADMSDPDLTRLFNIFNMGGRPGTAKRGSRQPDNYAGVKSVKLEVGFDGLELDFSVDGKVYVEARNSQNQGQYNPATGELSLGSLEGRLLLPKNSRGLRVEIDGRDGGSIIGKIAHPGEVRAPSSPQHKVDIGLCAPLEIIVEKERYSSGKIEIIGMVHKGNGRYVPQRPEVPTGALTIRASGMGEVTVRYESKVTGK